MKGLEEKIKELEGLNKEPLLAAAVELLKKNAEQEQLIEELNSELENASLGAETKSVVISFKKDKYKVTVAQYTKLDGSTVTAEELKDDEKEVERLLSINSGILEKISTQTEE